MKLLWSIALPYKPVSVDHAYPSARSGRRFLSAEGKTFRELVQWQIKTTYPGKLIAEPIAVYLYFVFGDKRRRDVDNYHKVLLDSFKGFLIEDDVQIQELHLYKSAGEEFLTTVKIYAL